MEDTLLMDAAERFVKGEMSAQEKIYFEDLRKNNPELDQSVVEHIFFLNQLEQFGSAKNFKNILQETENKLSAEYFITRGKKQSKVVTLWTKYRRTIAVAASIAGVVSLFIATLVSGVKTRQEPNLTPLVAKINATASKQNAMEDKLDKLQAGVNAASSNATPLPRVESGYRATGFMVDASSNYIVTNAHVVKEMRNSLVIENLKGVQYRAKAVYVNGENDLAILQVTDARFKNLAPLPYNIRKGGAELGEQIFTLGYPKPEIVYAEGYVSAKNGYSKNGADMDTLNCQLNTAARAGNSGSPVLTKNGELIGNISSKETNSDETVFAVKGINIYRAVDSVRKMTGHKNIKINSTPSLKRLSREDQIKKMEEYVFVIRGN